MLKDKVAEWQEKADHDLRSVNLIRKDYPLMTDILLFHCQQALEKSFKAFLVTNNVNFEQTHDLRLLCTVCSEIDPSLAMMKTECVTLNSFAVRIRYPNEINISDEMALHLANTTEKYCRTINGKIEVCLNDLMLEKADNVMETIKTNYPGMTEYQAVSLFFFQEVNKDLYYSNQDLIKDGLSGNFDFQIKENLSIFKRNMPKSKEISFDNKYIREIDPDSSIMTQLIKDINKSLSSGSLSFNYNEKEFSVSYKKEKTLTL